MSEQPSNVTAEQQEFEYKSLLSAAAEMTGFPLLELEQDLLFQLDIFGGDLRQILILRAYMDAALRLIPSHVIEAHRLCRVCGLLPGFYMVKSVVSNGKAFYDWYCDIHIEGVLEGDSDANVSGE